MSFDLGNRTSIITDEIRLIEGNELVDIRDLVSGTVPTNVYNKGQIDALLDTKADDATTYSITQVDGLLDDKQDTIGAGDLAIEDTAGLQDALDAKQDALGPGALDIADTDGLQEAIDAAALPAENTLLWAGVTGEVKTVDVANGTGGTLETYNVYTKSAIDGIVEGLEEDITRARKPEENVLLWGGVSNGEAALEQANGNGGVQNTYYFYNQLLGDIETTPGPTGATGPASTVIGPT